MMRSARSIRPSHGVGRRGRVSGALTPTTLRAGRSVGSRTPKTGDPRMPRAPPAGDDRPRSLVTEPEQTTRQDDDVEESLRRMERGLEVQERRVRTAINGFSIFAL